MDGKPKKKFYTHWWFWTSIIVLLIIIIGLNNSSIKTDSSKNSSSSETSKFQKTTIANLISGTVTVAPLVQVEGILTQKGEFTYINRQVGVNDTSYYLKIEDGGAAVLIKLKENILSNFNIGDQLSVNGAVGTLGNCANPGDTEDRKFCQEFKLTNANSRVIIPIKLQPTDNDIIVIKKSLEASVNNDFSKSSYVTETPKPQPTIPVTYSQVMNGLTGTLTMTEFTMGTNHGYDGSNTNLDVSFFIFGVDKNHISKLSLELFDPSVGYDPSLITFPSDFTQLRSLHNKILAQILNNIFPNWTDIIGWVNGAVSSCKQNGKEQSTIENSMKITANCSKSLGSYGIEIEPQ